MSDETATRPQRLEHRDDEYRIPHRIELQDYIDADSSQHPDPADATEAPSRSLRRHQPASSVHGPVVPTVAGSHELPAYNVRPAPERDHPRDLETGQNHQTGQPGQAPGPHKSKFELDNLPRGYPQLSWVMNSEEQFMIHRQFGHLRTRVLLHKADQLRELEVKLLHLDRQDAQNEHAERYLVSRKLEDQREQPDKRELLLQIEAKLLEYDNILLNKHQILALRKPPRSDWVSLKNYFWNEAPVTEEEASFILTRKDLVSLATNSEHRILGRLVEQICGYIPVVGRLFQTEETRAMTSRPYIHYYSNARIGTVATFINNTLVLILLAVPLVLLYYLTKQPSSDLIAGLSLTVLLVATFVFLCVVSLFTKAKGDEALAATAGYCAILVVFVGNIGKNGDS